MAEQPRTKAERQPSEFDVTVQTVIGSVVIDDFGSESTAVHAAFSLIADYATENAKGTELAGGEFSFPDPYGGLVKVTVENG